MDIGTRQIKAITVEAVITRADGTVEPQGVIAHRVFVPDEPVGRLRATMRTLMRRQDRE